MKPQIDELIRVHKLYIANSPSVDYLNRIGTPYSGDYLAGSADKALIYQLQGSAGKGNREVVVAINYDRDTLKVDHQINTRGGGVAIGSRFTDVLGRSAFPYALVDAGNRIFLQLPPKSYSVWVQETAPGARTAASAEDGIPDSSPLKVQVVPNPVHGTAQLRITSPVSGTVEIVVMGVNGRELRRKRRNIQKGPQSIVLDVAGLPVGSYLLSVYAGGLKGSTKLIVH